jgi:Fe-S cluster biogenesis protein NfuA
LLGGKEKIRIKFNFNKKTMTTDELRLAVENALEEIRPFLVSDGGDISLISIEDEKHVKVRLEGACTHCSVNQMTLRAGVETTIKKFAPQIETVVNIA